MGFCNSTRAYSDPWLIPCSAPPSWPSRVVVDQSLAVAAIVSRHGLSLSSHFEAARLLPRRCFNDRQASSECKRLKCLLHLSSKWLVTQSHSRIVLNKKLPFSAFGELAFLLIQALILVACGYYFSPRPLSVSTWVRAVVYFCFSTNFVYWSDWFFGVRSSSWFEVFDTAVFESSSDLEELRKQEHWGA
ncbi:hypothetical protein Bca52824_017065 [Brassica carinata]|uniref:Uncharacterized protein n=1 Tax=Brassica carinata TaxID=52824 RepID=A0A8X8AX14_BRACI|nr:hypothetical protein Bca52824_017065 [Brassica carinata]